MATVVGCCTAADEEGPKGRKLAFDYLLCDPEAKKDTELNPILPDLFYHVDALGVGWVRYYYADIYTFFI